MRSALVLLLILWPAQLRGQAARDTTVTVLGIVKSEAKGSSGWGLFLPAPLVVRGARLNWLVIEGEVRNIDNYRDRFVEMSAPVRLRSDSTGHVVAALVEPRLKERDPQAIVRRTVQLSVTQRATVSLAVEPSRFAWHDSTGGPSGVQPMLLFAVVNHGDIPIRAFFSRNEVFCVHVQSLEPALVDTAWAVLRQGVPYFSIRMGDRYFGVIELPPTAAPRRGRYRIRVELCARSEYGADLTFEVTG